MGIAEIWQFLDLKITAVASGVVEGERRMRGNAVPPNIFWGTSFPQIMSGQGGMVIHLRSPK